MAEAVRWSKLDNAAKIFPPTTDNIQTWVFRVSCQLVNTVEPEILQASLDETIKEFPFYSSVLRTGLFWYFFEESGLKPTVTMETKPPCSTLYDPSSGGPLFAVTYFGKRISLEVYHAITDGTGAIQFLRSLVFHYLTERHSDGISKDIVLSANTAALDDKEQDSFAKYYSKEKPGKLQKQQWAYQLKGECYPNNRLSVVEGTVPVATLRAVAKEYKATITEFLTAALMCSLYSVMDVRDRNKPVVIVIPVNLRKYFSSESARNFFSVANINHNFARDGRSFKEVLLHIQEQFKNVINEQKMYYRLNTLYKAEDNFLARLVPLAIKRVALRAAEWVSSKQNTASFSNIGKVEMPAELSRYIELFDFFSSTKNLNLCVCSFGDTMTISFTTHFTSAGVQRYFFKMLAQHGIKVRVSSNATVNGTEVNKNAPM